MQLDDKTQTFLSLKTLIEYGIYSFKKNQRGNIQNDITMDKTEKKNGLILRGSQIIFYNQTLNVLEYIDKNEQGICM